MNTLHQPVLLSIAYLGPARYFSQFLAHPEVIIEAKENYIKQSFRNRCLILSANGPLTLVIPVKYSNHPKTAIRDVQMDYDTPWNRIHWQAIVSAYKKAPFFEYYADDFLPFYAGKHRFLFDFDLELTQMILRLTGISSRISFTEKWQTQPSETKDYRNAIHPKHSKNKEDKPYSEKKYTQVFESRFGFTPGLSIMDLLFNCGPEVQDILTPSVQ